MKLWLLLIVIVTQGKSELGRSDPTNSNNENESWSDLSPRHRIKDPTYRLDRYPIGELPTNYGHCKRSAKCVPIQMVNATCMGARLPYDTTTLDFFPEDTNEQIIREKLHFLKALKHIPKCWSSVQPFLCSLFMPKCVNNTVDLPSYEMCKKVSGACRVVLNTTIWPNFIKCDDSKLFPRMCKDDFRNIEFNTTSECLNPLVPTDNINAVFEGVEGCGIPCKDPLYDDEEQKHIHSFMFWSASICGAFSLFTIITFFLDWRSSSKYPALVVFYMCFCILFSCIGCLLQFIPGNRENIVCKTGHTLRVSEPNALNLCVIVFIMVYYFLAAALVWFVILSFTWYMHFQSIGKIQDRIEKKSAYFHLLAWCLPLILTVAIMALGEIDGSYVTGICFVGYNNHAVRAWFVLGPVLISFLVGGYFLSRGLVTLICLKISSQEVLSEKYSSKIRQTIVRVGLVSVFTFVTVFITFYCHNYYFEHSWEWKQHFREYMLCKITMKFVDPSECVMKSRPSVAKLQLHIFAPFFAGILMSSWVWTKSTINTWARFFKRICNQEVEEPVKLKKHKVIAQAFAKRKMFNNAGRLSISFHNSHEDPVGLNFDFNSVASQDFSSTWAAALPKLVTRRGALVGGSVSSSNRRNSTDSQYSFSLRRVSIESRRNSCDSQFALSISEMKAELKTSRVNKSGKRRKKSHERGRKRSDSTYKRRRELEKSCSSKIIQPLRRGSSTSQESQLGVHILQALSIGASANAAPLQMPNMKRRAGLDEGQLALKDAERLLPFLFPKQSDSDENASSEETNNKLRQIMGKKDVEKANTAADEEEDSQPEEDTKMLEPEPRERNRVSKRTSAECQTKYAIEDETVLKHLLCDHVLDDNDNSAKPEDEDDDDAKSVSSISSSDCQDLRSNADGHAREIATQTLPFDLIEIEALKQNIDEIINSRNCLSKGTQISPKLKKNKNKPK